METAVRGPVVRRVRADEWLQLRTLRLEALRDPDAPLAFLESHDDAAARPDEFWHSRTAAAAVGDHVAQFVGVDARDSLLGSVTVIVQAPGSLDHHGAVVPQRRAMLVGVYVRPTHRGDGLITALVDAGAGWARERGFRQLFLDVHRENARAQGAYRREGFAPSGVAFTSVIGPEIEMVREL